jgi:hypothetical protein
MYSGPLLFQECQWHHPDLDMNNKWIIKKVFFNSKTLTLFAVGIPASL